MRQQYTVLMDSISMTFTQPTGLIEALPWTRMTVGVRLKSGGLKYMPWVGYLPKSWVPRWGSPVALAATSWKIGTSGELTVIPSGFVVGVMIDGRVWVVLYEGRPREA